MRQRIKLLVNQKNYEVDVEPHGLLSEVSCNEGECGACTVIMEGDAICSCMMLAINAEGKNIETIEGLEENGELHPIQHAFIDNHGMQCGFCTPGMILSAKALLDQNTNPTDRDIRETIAGNLCRCGSYPKIVKSIMVAAENMRGDRHE